ncbi:MAG: hypothetical protein GY753_09810 [Gammaproteobacteria bacterium]|nr:hypothetical protein [Gammaproteobacteria bacterium]
MSSKVDIYNMALGMIGESGVQSPTEKSTQRYKCDIFYPIALESLLAGQVSWGFAKKVVALAEEGDPPDNWQYQYTYPSNAVRLLGVIQSDKTQPEIPYEVGATIDDDARVIWCDTGSAYMKYIDRMEDASKFPGHFVDALTASLAMRIAMPLTRKLPVMNAMIKLYREAVSAAATISADEQIDDLPGDAPWIEAR